MIPRRSLHRAVFTLAGCYNIAWGIYASLDPQWMFRFAGMEPISHPEIFAGLGFLLCLFGIGYLEVARSPENGFALAAIGLIGKFFGPLGQVPLLIHGQWPMSLGWLAIPNDLIWWIPFALYLRDTWPFYRRTFGSTSEQS